jgi:hypothetical protein
MLTIDLQICAHEGDLRMVLNVEEVSAPQMRIALRFARPNESGVDHCPNSGQAGILGIEVQSALHVLEGTTDVSDHHVPGSKLRGAMTWLEDPFGHQILPARLAQNRAVK